MLTLTLVVLAQAAGSNDYPKVLRKEGHICVQTLDAKGVVEESCRAEGSDFRTPLPATGSTPLDARPPIITPKATPGPPTPGALYWADAKKNWGLAFKIGAVGAISATLVATVGALVAASSGVPRAADPYLATAAVSGTGALLFTLVAVLFDRWGFHEIEPEEEG